jgi:hypothetical protein
MNITNVKSELLEFLKGLPKVKCATISYNIGNGINPKEILLKVGYSESEYSEFLKNLDFTYNASLTGDLSGTIWFVDNTWCEREECDYSEWWEHKYCPEIPKELQ